MSDISVEEFKKFEAMDLPFSYNEVILIIEEVKEHPLLWHSFGDKRKLAIEWNQVEMKFQGSQWADYYGEIRSTWRYLYNLYMADRTDEFLFEDQMDFLWEYRAEAYWIWDEEEEDYKYPESHEPIPEDAIFFWDEDQTKRKMFCCGIQYEEPQKPCVDCSEYHDESVAADYVFFDIKDFAHDCFEKKTCYTTRFIKAYHCYHDKRNAQTSEKAFHESQAVAEQAKKELDRNIGDRIDGENHLDEEDEVSDDSGIMDANQEHLEEEEEPAPAPQAAAPANQGQWKDSFELLAVMGLLANLLFLIFFA